MYHLELETSEMVVAFEIDAPVTLAELEAKISAAAHVSQPTENTRELGAEGAAL